MLRKFRKPSCKCFTKIRWKPNLYTWLSYRKPLKCFLQDIYLSKTVLFSPLTSAIASCLLRRSCKRNARDVLSHWASYVIITDLLQDVQCQNRPRQTHQCSYEDLKQTNTSIRIAYKFQIRIPFLELDTVLPYSILIGFIQLIKTSHGKLQFLSCDWFTGHGIWAHIPWTTNMVGVRISVCSFPLKWRQRSDPKNFHTDDLALQRSV